MMARPVTSSAVIATTASRAPPAHGLIPRAACWRRLSGWSSRRTDPVTMTLQPSLKTSSMRSISKPTVPWDSRTFAVFSLVLKSTWPFEPVVHRKGYGAAGCAKDDPPDTPGLEMRPTLRRCQWFKNGPWQCASASRRSVPVTTEKAGRRDLKNVSHPGERPSAQLFSVPLEILQEAGIHTGLSGQVLRGQTKLLATIGDPSSKVSGLHVRAGLHTASVHDGSLLRLGKNVPPAQELGR